ncbi:MAG: sigma-54 dependent transcriptional regulator [Planctomycetota bacterium]|nr:sigma-54 dependent transcriptional regulator [Planctomycetota bacterium]
MNPLRILVVQPDPAISSSMVSILQTIGCRVEQAENDREAARMLERSNFHGVICLTNPKDPDVLELLQFIRRKFPAVGFVLQLLSPSPEFREEALSQGAIAVLDPPMSSLAIKNIVSQLRNHSQSNQSQSFANSSIHQASSGNRNSINPVNGWLVGHDPALRKTLELAENIIQIDTPVLILGDRGTGKSSLARWIHERGPNANGAYVECNCQNPSETALETEIFGLLTTGPSGELLQRPGYLDTASNGTIVFDEPQHMSSGLQQKILRFLQTGEFQPVGSNQVRRSNARPVFTTREAISTLVQRDKFRQDLYYRISVVVLKLPPLCLRGNDIELLGRHFLAIYSRRLGKPLSDISPDAMRMLADHGWPGNVYELESVIHRGVILAQQGVIQPSHLIMMPAANQPSARSLQGSTKLQSPLIRPLKESLAEPEKQLILQALEALSWNRQETARVLDINRTTLYKKMKKYQLLTEEDHAEGVMDLA